MSEGAAEVTLNSTRRAAKLSRVAFARVPLVIETKLRASGGRRTNRRGSNAGLSTVIKAFVSSAKTGCCPAVTKGRNESRGFHFTFSPGAVSWEIDRKSASGAGQVLTER